MALKTYNITDASGRFVGQTTAESEREARTYADQLGSGLKVTKA